MRRLGLWIVVLGACAGSREVSKLRYTSTDCPDPNGCSAPLGEQAYQLPDEAHDPVSDAASTSDGPSCKTVAVALAALEFGNYSTEETEDERAAIVVKQQQLCASAKLDAREMACMSTVTDVKHVGYCTRKMGAPTPRVPMLSEMECKELMLEIRPQLQNYGTGEHATSFEASCIKDGWSNELANCLRQRGGYDLLNQCRAEAPGWVFDQIQARIEKQQAAAK